MTITFGEKIGNLFKKGHYEQRIDSQVQEQIDQINNYIESYNSIKSHIPSLVDSLENCATNLSNSYDLFTEALIIGDVSYTQNVETIKTLSQKMKNNAESLMGQLSIIDNEITRLTNEKVSLEGKLYYTVFVEDK